MHVVCLLWTRPFFTLRVQLSMSKSTILSFAKATLPQPVRRLLRGCLHYTQRVGRWPIILWQIRGVSWSDQWILFKSALAAPFLSFENLLAWQDPVLLADAQIEVRGVGHFFVRSRCDDLWHVLPWREQVVVKTVKDRLQKGNVFIDAGANIGFYTILASRIVGDSGRVLAIEMMPDTASILRQHLVLNQTTNVTVIEKALSDTTGQTITARVHKGHYGQASIAGVIHGDARAVSVSTITLSQVLDELTRVSLMKMDLEGAEYMALRGAGDALARVDTICFEQWQADSKVANQLRDAGFIVSAIDGRNQIAIKSSS